MANPQALVLEQPLDMDDARRASRRLADLRRDAEAHHERLIGEAAAAERDYRKALGVAFTRARAQGGGAGESEMVARAEVADLSYQRDLKTSLVKAAQERLRGLEGERSMLKSLIDWSARLDPFAISDRSERA